MGVWNTATGEIRFWLVGHDANVWGVCFSPDDATMISGGMDQTVCIRDARTGQLLRSLRGHSGWVTAVHAARYTPDR